MLARRLRRWSSIVPTFGWCLVFAEREANMLHEVNDALTC